MGATLRALFLPAQPGDHPSTTSRVLAYVPWLSRRGWQCVVSEPTPAWLRPLEGGNLAARAVYYAVWLVRRLADIARCRSFDVVFVQRDLYPFSAGLLERLLLARHPAILYDIDDALHEPQPGRSTSVLQRLRPLAKYDLITRGASQVVVASPELARHVSELNPRWTVVPMTIDCDRYDAARSRRVTRDEIVIGWSGSKASLRYLFALRDALAVFVAKPRRRVRIITGTREAVPDFGFPVEIVKWTAEREAEDLVDLDIGLLPLEDTPFERGKFPYKAVQYCAAAVPILASSVGYTREIVRNGENGYLISQPDQWIARLEALAADAAQRVRLGAAGRGLARSQFDIEVNAAKLEVVLRNAAAL